MEIFKNSDGYAPLLINLESYWDRSFKDLPDEINALVAKHFPPLDWDALSAESRKYHAVNTDYQNDVNLEPSMYFQLYIFQDDLKDWIETARQEKKDAVVVALRDVADRVEKILETDRARVGAHIQALRIELNELREAKKVSWPGLDSNAADYPPELDIALQTWRAITTQRDSALKPKAQATKWLTDMYPKLANEAKERIATICNWDKTGGRGRNL